MTITQTRKVLVRSFSLISFSFSIRDLISICNVLRSNVSVQGSPYLVGAEDDVVKNIPAAAAKPAAPIDPSVDKWFFISGTSNL
jgi:hypothetical protein